MTSNDAILDGLLARIAGGDTEAMELLFARERIRLFHFFRRLSRCEAQAEDLLQNTFLNLWRYRQSFGHRKCASAYLYKVALNQWRADCTKDIRRKRVQEQAARDLEEHTWQPPEADLEARERERAVWESIEALPEAQKLTFLLHRFQGLSCASIAETTGESVKTVESRLRLALGKLTEKLRLREGLK